MSGCAADKKQSHTIQEIIEYPDSLNLDSRDLRISLIDRISESVIRMIE
jgi:hypothetical protein